VGDSGAESSRDPEEEYVQKLESIEGSESLGVKNRILVSFKIIRVI